MTLQRGMAQGSAAAPLLQWMAAGLVHQRLVQGMSDGTHGGTALRTCRSPDVTDVWVKTASQPQQYVRAAGSLLVHTQESAALLCAVMCGTRSDGSRAATDRSKAYICDLQLELQD